MPCTISRHAEPGRVVPVSFSKPPQLRLKFRSVRCAVRPRLHDTNEHSYLAFHDIYNSPKILLDLLFSRDYSLHYRTLLLLALTTSSRLVSLTSLITKEKSMLKKRLLILGVLLCALLGIAPQPSRAGSWCSCATTCSGGDKVCTAECYPDPGTSDAEVTAAAVNCCQQNQVAIEAAGGMSCTASGPSSVPVE